MKAAQRHILKDIFIESLNIFDVYQRKEIPTDIKNIGIAINYCSDSKTLVDSEIRMAFNPMPTEIENYTKQGSKYQ
jgi:phenylalanyl-tRNA synthetase beta subunit